MNSIKRGRGRKTGAKPRCRPQALFTAAMLAALLIVGAAGCTISMAAKASRSLPADASPDSIAKLVGGELTADVIDGQLRFITFGFSDSSSVKCTFITDSEAAKSKSETVAKTRLATRSVTKFRKQYGPTGARDAQGFPTYGWSTVPYTSTELVTEPYSDTRVIPGETVWLYRSAEVL